MRNHSSRGSGLERLARAERRVVGLALRRCRTGLTAGALAATLVPALLVPAAPALADGAGMTSAGPSQTVSPVEGSKYTEPLGSITANPCEGPVIEIEHAAHRVSRVPAPGPRALAAADSRGVTPADSTSECGALAPQGYISWGDGTPTTAATFTPEQTEIEEGGVRSDTGPPIVGSDCTSDSSTECTWTVTDGGAHVYAHAGDYTVTWYYRIYEAGEYQPYEQGWTGTVKVGLAAQTITVTNVTVTRNSSNAATLTASLNYPDAAASACDFTATIDWGDGDTDAPATVQNFDSETFPDCGPPINDNARRADAKPAIGPGGTPGPPWEIVGSHTYSGSSAPARDTAVVTVTYDYPASDSGDSDNATDRSGDRNGPLRRHGDNRSGDACRRHQRHPHRDRRSKGRHRQRLLFRVRPDDRLRQHRTLLAVGIKHQHQQPDQRHRGRDGPVVQHDIPLCAGLHHRGRDRVGGRRSDAENAGTTAAGSTGRRDRRRHEHRSNHRHLQRARQPRRWHAQRLPLRVWPRHCSGQHDLFGAVQPDLDIRHRERRR
jgi:hypothetical protein